MALTSVQIPPGVHPDLPEYMGEGLWRRSDKIRFVGDRVENIGSWQRLSASTMIGAPRAMVAWSLLNGTKVFAVSTHLKLYIARGGRQYDITPLRASGTAGSSPISVVSGSREVTFTLVSHGANVGDYIRLASASPVGGVDADGEWIVKSIPSANSLTFEVPAPATATATGGGSLITYEFDIRGGRQHVLPGRGYGAGPYGAGTYGGPRQGATAITIRMPTLATWGEDLIACIGDLYRWDASSDVTTRAAPIPGAPTNNIGVLVSPNDRHLMVLGADGDPMQVQWPDQGTYSSWTPGEDSTANKIRLSDGSRIISARVVQNVTLVWTDTALFGIEYVNQFDASHRTYRIAGIDPPLSWNSVVVDGATAWWMAANQIYRYDGRVSVVPTDMTETVFGELDRQQAEKIFGGTNYRWSEVHWFYPAKSETATPQENSRYAKINTQNGAADVGSLARSVWIDSGVFKEPMAADADGRVYRHEMQSVIHDVALEFSARQYPHAPAKVYGPYKVVPTTRKLDRRMRGRSVSMKVLGTMRCDGEDVRWFIESGLFDIGEGDEIMQVLGVIPDIAFLDAVSVGKMRFDIQPDGEQ